jgi:hypothetical protein
LYEFFETLKQSTYYIIDINLVDMSLVDMNPVDVSFVGLSSVNLPLGDLALSSLYWGGLHRRKGGSDSEDSEEVGLHVGRYDIVVFGRITKKVLVLRIGLKAPLILSFSGWEKAALLIVINS